MLGPATQLNADSSQSAVRFAFSLPTLMSTKAAGSMEPDSAARRSFLSSLGIESDRFVRLDQIHSRDVVIATAGVVAQADGLVSGDRDLVLGVTVADCMPIVVDDPATGAFALLHSGRRGTGILRDAVELMSDRFGSDPRSLSVLLGPAVSAARYEVDSATATSFAKEFGEETVVRVDQRAHIDLRAANRSLCDRLGIGRIVDIAICTATNEWLGSRRREGEEYTRMLFLAGGIE